MKDTSDVDVDMVEIHHSDHNSEDEVGDDGDDGHTDAKIAEIRKFYDLEKQIFTRYRGILSCKKCNRRGVMKSNGSSGAATKCGMKRLQLKCKFCPSTTERLNLALSRHSECAVASEELNKRYGRLQAGAIIVEEEDDMNDNNIQSANNKRDFRKITKDTAWGDICDVEESHEELVQDDNTGRKRSRDQGKLVKTINYSSKNNASIGGSEEKRVQEVDWKLLFQKEVEKNNDLLKEKRIREEQNRKNDDIIELLREEINTLKSALYQLKDTVKKMSGNNNNNANNNEKREKNNNNSDKNSGIGEKEEEIKNNTEKNGVDGENGKNIPRKSTSYADAAKKSRPGMSSEKVKEMNKAFAFLQPPTVPQEFKKIFISWHPSRGLKDQGRKVVLHYAYRLLESLKINKKVREISLIGNSIIELYIAGICYDDVIKILELKKVNYTSELDRNEDKFNKDGVTNDKSAQIINRIAFLLSRNFINNLRKCILEGYPSGIVEAALEKEKEIIINRANSGKNMKNPGFSNTASVNNKDFGDKNSFSTTGNTNSSTSGPSRSNTTARNTDTTTTDNDDYFATSSNHYNISHHSVNNEDGGSDMDDDDI